MLNNFHKLIVLFAALNLVSAVDGQEFESVSNILSQHCISCHNDAEAKGGISLESEDGFAELASPGDPKNSLLVEVITGHQNERPSMPKSGPALTAEQVEKIERWVEAGENWPAGRTIEPTRKIDFNWWSFKALSMPEVPELGFKNPIDSFIAQKHREQGLGFAKPADRRTLIRRVTYDLTGLPPTYAAVEAFMADNSPDAFAKVVDRLLASPHYGEKWAQHWLDVVKYADTCGYDKDKMRPNAWPYRDYVIRAFNEDKSYSRFIEEQIAGDTLYPDTRDGIIGLGFVAAGPWDFIGHVEVPESKTDGKVARNLDRDEMLSNTLNTFTSITIQCARCHDHKFDPFTQLDYYRQQAIFAAVDRAERVYERDPEAVAREAEINNELAQINSLETTAENDFDQLAGAKRAFLKEQINDFQNEQPAKHPQFGYHSELSENQDAQKWVQVDLGQPTQIKKVLLRPCHDQFAGIGAGFGFPVRFRVEADGETVFETDENFSNPAMKAFELDLDREIQVIRVIATKLFDRAGQFNFALAEVQAINAEGENIAFEKPVEALDSIEAPERWAASNLTDGIWYEGVGKLNAVKKQLEDLKRQILGDERIEELRELATKKEQLEKELSELPRGKVVYAASTQFDAQGNFKPTNGAPREIRLLARGEVSKSTGDRLTPALPRLTDEVDAELPADLTEAEYRAHLAKWISSPDNPLTWRSIVNRVWQHHFGVGLVATPNDFGRMGATPTHPELLDWLATRFRDSGSFKQLHREIVLSETYQQSSSHDSKHHSIDAGNQFLWRAHRRKLSAEELRDSLLWVSGQLDRTMGGPGFHLFRLEKTEHSPHYEYHKFDHESEKSHRRSIYRFVVRSQPDPFLTTLDCADSSASTPRRVETQTPLQSLSLLNNQFNLVMAEHCARHFELLETDQIVPAFFRRALQREPTQEETEILNDYLKKHGPENLARTIFNLNEFMFID